MNKHKLIDWLEDSQRHRRGIINRTGSVEAQGIYEAYSYLLDKINAGDFDDVIIETDIEDDDTLCTMCYKRQATDDFRMCQQCENERINDGYTITPAKQEAI